MIDASHYRSFLNCSCVPSILKSLYLMSSHSNFQTYSRWLDLLRRNSLRIIFFLFNKNGKSHSDCPTGSLDQERTQPQKIANVNRLHNCSVTMKLLEKWMLFAQSVLLTCMINFSRPFHWGTMPEKCSWSGSISESHTLMAAKIVILYMERIVDILSRSLTENYIERTLSGRATTKIWGVLFSFNVIREKRNQLHTSELFFLNN